MSVHPVSPFNTYGFTTPAPKTQEIKPAVIKVQETPDEKKDIVELPKKPKENKKMSMSDKVMITLLGLAFLTAVGVMGRNGCFGKSIQKFLGENTKAKPTKSKIFTSLILYSV